MLDSMSYMSNTMMLKWYEHRKLSCPMPRILLVPSSTVILIDACEPQAGIMQGVTIAMSLGIEIVNPWPTNELFSVLAAHGEPF